jgi:PAS domain-containing protein
MDGATLVPRALELLRTSGDLLYTLGNLAGFVAMLAIASYVWQHRDAPQAATLAVLTAGAALWSGSVALQQVGTDYYVLRASLQVTYLGITVATAGWIAFALAFTNREELLTRRVAAALAVEPILVTLVGSTNEIAGHYLFWATMEPASDGLTTAYGIGFWFHSIYTWTVLFVGAVLLIQHFVRYRSVYRWQSVAGLVAVVAPWAGSIAFVTGNVEVDFGPLGIVVSGIAFGWAIANYELIDLAPIARRTAWGELEDAVVTLDEDDRVVDANEAAIELFDVEEPPEGKPAAEFFAAVPNEVLTELDDVDDVDTQLTVRLEDEQRYLSLSISPIGGSGT